MTELDQIIESTYQWSKQQSFKGFNKHDALNSPLLNFVLGWSKWTRIIAIQGVMRFPINLRSLLLTRKTFNPKGLALFASGLVDCYKYSGDEHYLIEAERLVSLLLEIKSEGEWSGDCWGYHYPWQDLNFFASSNLPNAIVTVFVCEAILDVYDVTKNEKYLRVVESAAAFLTKDLPPLYVSEGERCLSYIPTKKNKARVMDVSILVGALLSRYCHCAKHGKYQEIAKSLVAYVVNRQCEDGAWFYTDPPKDSPIRHDNYHTGFILDALSRYQCFANTDEYDEVYEKGLRFYRQNLFNSDGSPKWMSDQDYPHDIHGAAQGLITFSRHIDEDAGLLEKISSWTIKNLYSGKGRFYYQKHKHFTKKVTFMRWCNAWSFKAFASYRLATQRMSDEQESTHN